MIWLGNKWCTLSGCCSIRWNCSWYISFSMHQTCLEKKYPHKNHNHYLCFYKIRRTILTCFSFALSSLVFWQFYISASGLEYVIGSKQPRCCLINLLLNPGNKPHRIHTQSRASLKPAGHMEKCFFAITWWRWNKTLSHTVWYEAVYCAISNGRWLMDSYQPDGLPQKKVLVHHESLFQYSLVLTTKTLWLTQPIYKGWLLHHQSCLVICDK